MQIHDFRPSPILRRRFGTLALALLLAGCAAGSQDAPTAREVLPASLGLHHVSLAFPSVQWWTTFNDPVLDKLVDHALRANPSLAQAGARLEQARAAAGIAGSGLQPHLGASLSSTREQFSANDIYPPPFGGSMYTENQLMLQGGWEIDFFGRNRARLDAALGTARAAAAQAQAARVLLASNVVATYVQLARTEARRHTLEQILGQKERIVAVVGARVREGLEPTLQLRPVQTDIPKLRLQLEQNAEVARELRHALAALSGQGPDATAHLAPTLRVLPTPALPRELPAEIVGHRADVVAARWQVRAALAGVREARAAFYPNVNLSAFIGLDALGATQFLTAGSRTFGVGPAVTLPLFEGGALRAQLRGRAAAADAAIDEYNATVLGAVRDVADAVARRRSADRQIRQQDDALRLAREAHALARKRFEAGLGNDLAVLSAQGAVLQLELVGDDLKAQALLDDVALMRALGGGYRDPGAAG